ncbi:MAG: hypothetical protein R3D29_05825 [Nitratireductor sp.]
MKAHQAHHVVQGNTGHYDWNNRGASISPVTMLLVILVARASPGAARVPMTSERVVAKATSTLVKTEQIHS